MAPRQLPLAASQRQKCRRRPRCSSLQWRSVPVAGCGTRCPWTGCLSGWPAGCPAGSTCAPPIALYSGEPSCRRVTYSDSRQSDSESSAISAWAARPVATGHSGRDHSSRHSPPYSCQWECVVPAFASCLDPAASDSFGCGWWCCCYCDGGEPVGSVMAVGGNLGGGTAGGGTDDGASAPCGGGEPHECLVWVPQQPTQSRARASVRDHRPLRQPPQQLLRRRVAFDFGQTASKSAPCGAPSTPQRCEDRSGPAMCRKTLAYSGPSARPLKRPQRMLRALDMSSHRVYPVQSNRHRDWQWCRWSAVDSPVKMGLKSNI